MEFEEKHHSGVIVRVSRYWKISCGRRGRLAPIHRSLGVVTVDFSVDCDLSTFTSFDEWLNYLKSSHQRLRGVEAVEQCWLFSHEIGLGDTIIGYGDKTALLIGTVVGPYRYGNLKSSGFQPLQDTDINLSKPQHHIQVEWKNQGEMKTDVLTKDVRVKLTQLKAILELSDPEGREIMNAARKMAIL